MKITFKKVNYNGPINTDPNGYGGADRMFFTYIYNEHDRKNLSKFKDQRIPKNLCASAPKF